MLQKIFSSNITELGVNDKCPGVRSIRELLPCVPGTAGVQEEVKEKVSRSVEWNLYSSLLMKEDEGTRS